MQENIVEKLTVKDDKYACAFADKIISESKDSMRPLIQKDMAETERILTNPVCINDANRRRSKWTIKVYHTVVPDSAPCKGLK